MIAYQKQKLFSSRISLNWWQFFNLPLINSFFYSKSWYWVIKFAFLSSFLFFFFLPLLDESARRLITQHYLLPLLRDHRCRLSFLSCPHLFSLLFSPPPTSHSLHFSQLSELWAALGSRPRNIKPTPPYFSSDFIESLLKPAEKATLLLITSSHSFHPFAIFRHVEREEYFKTYPNILELQRKQNQSS